MVDTPERSAMIRIPGDRRGSRWRIYPTPAARDRAMRRYVRRGYRYLVRWKDKYGWGLEAVWRAQWQPEGECPVSIQ